MMATQVAAAAAADRAAVKRASERAAALKRRRLRLAKQLDITAGVGVKVGPSVLACRIYILDRVDRLCRVRASAPSFHL
jgi:hypothetical protein